MRVQVVELKVPEALLVKVRVPVGVIVVPEEASPAVAVHIEIAFTGSEPGEQTTLTVEERFDAVRLKLPELTRWSVSAP